MKKIILLLTFIYNFSFALVYPNGWVDNEHYIYQDVCYERSTLRWSGTGASGSQCLAPYKNFNYITKEFIYAEEPCNYKTTYPQWSWTDYYYYSSVVDMSVCQNILNPTPTCTENEELVDGQCVPKCSSTQTRNQTTLQCEENCDPLNNIYQDGAGGCFDCSRHSTISEIGQCFCNYTVLDGGQLTDVSSISTIDNVDGIDYEVTQITCNNALTMDIWNKITEDTLVHDPCITRDGWNPPNGYIFKGTVQKDIECSQFVDGVNYLHHLTELANSDCPTDLALYCYLKPNLYNNDLGLTNPNTLPNGEIPVNDVPVLDFNSSVPNNLLWDSVAKTNALLSQLTGDFKKYYEWQKVSQNGWVKSLTEDGRQLLKELEKNRGADTNGSRNIVNAVNAQGQSIVDKLQELVDKNSSINVDKLYEEDYDINGTGYELVDINVSLDTGFFDALLSNFTTAYENMNNDLSTLSQNANDLISMLETEKETAFNISLPRSTVTTCPYTSVLDLGFQTLDIEIDICKVVNPLYSIFYLVFSIIFSSIIVIFGFNALMKLGN